MSKKKHLTLYLKFLKTGELENHPKARTNGGLCSIGINTKELIELFRPDSYGNCYWAYGEKWTKKDEESRMKVLSHEFTPLRQNILLLMAAMNNEL